MNVFGNEGGGDVHVWGPVVTTTVELSGFPAAKRPDWALAGIQLNAEEVVDIRRCFEDETYIYALGNDQGRCLCAMTFIVFLSGDKCDEGNALSSLDAGMDSYKRNRISKNQQRSTLTVGKFSTYGWLQGIRVGNTDPERGICYATVEFLMDLAGK